MTTQVENNIKQHGYFTSDLSANVYNKLKNDNPKARESGTHINGLKCPSCGKNEAFAYVGSPMAIMCHRNNECGVTTPVKHVYPELWQDLAKRYPSTPVDKKATARAYLESRGLNPSSIEFSQGYKDNHQTLVIEQAGVTFERLIDYKVDGHGKNRLSPYKGKVFESEKVKDSKSVFVTEGVFEALSLDQSGIASISTYSSGSLPAEYYQSHSDKEYVLAFNNDSAGIKGIQKTINCFNGLGITNYKIALTPKGKDWNDLLVNRKLIPGTIEKTLDKAYWQGKLAFAKNAFDHYEIYRERYPFLDVLVFEFDSCMFKGYQYSSKVNGRSAHESKVSRLTDCALKILYSIEDDSVIYDSKLSHIVELKSKREGVNRVVFRAEELATPNNFRTKLANQRQISDCEQKDLLRLVEHLYQDKPSKVRRVQSLGYDHKSGNFALSHFLYDKTGKRHELNKDGFFNQGIMPFNDRQCVKSISSLADSDVRMFVNDVYGAFSERGLISLGFWIASAFSHTVFDRFGFFPFISLYGGTHTGKSTITKIFNQCFFVDWEGISMTKANTQKGELRRISQKSSLVTPMLECTGTDNARFSMDTLLGAYNRAPLATRAQTTQGNETLDVPINGTMAFVQNIEPFTTRAQKERVISVHFADNSLDVTSEHFTRLVAMSSEQLAGIGDYVLRNREIFEGGIIQAIEDYSACLMDVGVSTDRIAKNHAVALAAVNILLDNLNIDINSKGVLTSYVASIAKTKCSSAETELDIAEHFFSMLDDLDSTSGVFNHDSATVFVVMKIAIKGLKDKYGYSTPESVLYDQLKKHKRYREHNSAKYIKALGKTEKCWVFTK